MAEKKTFWHTLPGYLTGLAALITAGVAIYNVIPDKPVPEKCASPWTWNNELQHCTKTVSIAGKTFSIPLDRTITQVRGGRIDFYINQERLPGTDTSGRAIYKRARGVVQVVIPIMLDKTMVGERREVVYSTNDGGICSVSSLPETTDHLKAMRAAYSLRLVDCAPSGALCRVDLVPPGRRVHIETSPLKATIGPNC